MSSGVAGVESGLTHRLVNGGRDRKWRLAVPMISERSGLGPSSSMARARELPGSSWETKRESQSVSVSWLNVFAGRNPKLSIPKSASILGYMDGQVFEIRASV